MIRTFVLGVVAISALGLVVSPVHATFARVESMGKSSHFFMDDISIFDNPANMNIFPNFLIGELGTYRSGQADVDAISQVDVHQGTFNNPRYNRDPQNSWFGGIFSYSLSGNRDGGSLYPQVSIGGAFNRKDGELFALLPDSADGWVVPEPASNFDGFLGLTLANGGMLGSHIYFAIQEGADLRNGQLIGAPNPNINVRIIRGDVGLNWPLARNIDGELSTGGALVGYGPESVDPEWSFFLKGRAFSTLEIINGELVPIFNYSILKAPGQEITRRHFGLGVNVSMDRGFFWLGVKGVLDENAYLGMTQAGNSLIYSSLDPSQNTESIRGGIVSFGIERNIWWDWLVLRVGGQKEITYRNIQGTQANFNYIHTNPVANATADDHVGFGIGINIEEKLKIDATLAEDIVYTFGNLFSGPHHHIISRISATYSF